MRIAGRVSTPVALSLVFAISSPLQAQDSRIHARTNPVEIGLVSWNRNLDAALEQSKQDGKPVFLLFQEVPGCAGCQKFGRQVLSHPLLVEAIEDEFIPVVIFNNRSEGSDKLILARFGERPWNYQVIRFLDGEGKDIVERKEGIWSLDGVSSRMISVLEAHDREVPNYLQTVASSSESSTHALTAFAMKCFWTGERRLGAIEGVVATEAGWLEGREVTLVKYDPTVLSLESLAREAAKAQCADRIYTPRGASVAGIQGGRLSNSYRVAAARDQKRQLWRNPEVVKLPGINAMQLTKLNSLASEDSQQALSWLSPRQREQLQAARP